jgi:lactase-phlorizin hydrolase
VLHPIYSATGDYPTVMKKWMTKKSKEEGYSRSRLSIFTNEEMEMVKGEFYFRINSEEAKRKGNFCENKY